MGWHQLLGAHPASFSRNEVEQPFLVTATQLDTAQTLTGTYIQTIVLQKVRLRKNAVLNDSGNLDVPRQLYRFTPASLVVAFPPPILGGFGTKRTGQPAGGNMIGKDGGR